MTTGVPWGWWDYSCWWWWQWIIHCGFGVRRVFFIILSVFRAFLNIFSSPSSVKEEKVNLARKCSCLQTFANTSQEAQKINCKKINTNKKSKGVQCITWGDQLPSIKFLLYIYDSVLKGRFVFLYSCSLYSHPDYRYLHWTDCGRLIIEKSIKKIP